MNRVLIRPLMIRIMRLITTLIRVFYKTKENLITD